MSANISLAGRRTVVLIGMPGAGKSTCGALLAARLGCDFIDTDQLIEQQARASLQQILDRQGYLALRRIEQQVLLESALDAGVIATGGSAVYSDAVMRKLAALGVVVYLYCAPQELQRRIDNFATRGIARPPEQDFAALFRERDALYRRYASVVIDVSAPVSNVVEQLAALAEDRCCKP